MDKENKPTAIVEMFRAKQEAGDFGNPNLNADRIAKWLHDTLTTLRQEVLDKGRGLGMEEERSKTSVTPAVKAILENQADNLIKVKVYEAKQEERERIARDIEVRTEWLLESYHCDDKGLPMRKEDEALRKFIEENRAIFNPTKQ